MTATAVFTYTSANGKLDYAIDFTSPIVLTMAHVHKAAVGLNGPVLVPIATGDNTFSPGDPLIGSVTVPVADRAALLKGELYVNFHTAAHPGGEIRGQIVPALADTALRLPVYANARPASNIAATGTIDPRNPAVTSGTLTLSRHRRQYRHELAARHGLAGLGLRASVQQPERAGQQLRSTTRPTWPLWAWPAMSHRPITSLKQ